jgi:hypothetical protein
LEPNEKVFHALPPTHPSIHPSLPPSLPHGALLVVGYLFVCDDKHNTMFIHVSLSSKFFICYALYWWMSSENGGKVDIILGKFLDFSRFKPKLHVKF